MKNTMKEINLNEMEKVNGGYIFRYGDYDHNCVVYEVINDKTGDVMETFYYDDIDGAFDYADSHGMCCWLITWDELAQLRAGKKIEF